MEQKINRHSSKAVVEMEPDIKTVILQPGPELKNIQLKMKKKVTWTEDTIDNEHMKKKKSKSIFNNYLVCCIYKKPRLNPEDSSSSSCSSCDEKGKNAYERPSHYDRKKVI